MVKQRVIAFNHIDSSIPQEIKTELLALYATYHKLAKCYKYKYKRLRKVKIGLNVAAVGFTAIGGIVGGATLLIPVIAVFSGLGVLTKTYLSQSNIEQNVTRCKMATTTYDKVCVQIKSLLRGNGTYNRVAFLSDLKVIDDFVLDQAPSVGERESVKYGRNWSCVERPPSERTNTEIENGYDTVF